LLAGIAVATGFALRARFSLRPRLTALALRARWSLLAGIALRTWISVFALESWFALGTGFAALALRARCARVALGTSSARCAVVAVLQLGQALVHARHHLGWQRGHGSAQLSDDGLRLRLDQSALALPFAPLVVQHACKNRAPCVKEQVAFG
jgi:hypothetical protein